MFISQLKKIKDGVAPSTGKPWTLYEATDGDGKTYGTFLNLQEGNEYQVEIQPSQKGKPTIIKARLSSSAPAKANNSDDLQAIWQELRYLREKVDEILLALRKQ